MVADAGAASALRLAEVVLLHGSLRPRNINTEVGRSILDLPLTPNLTVLGHWEEQLRQIGAPPVQLTIVHGANVPPPTRPAVPGIVLRPDPRPMRGTGGVLADVLTDRQPDDRVLVGYGSHVLRQPLTEIYQELCAVDADIVAWADLQHTPGGLFLVRCGCLHHVPRQGFVDFKEQALARMAGNATIKVVFSPATPPIVMRSLWDYLQAMLAFAGPQQQGHEKFDRPVLIEPGAQVAAGARVYSSVVLRGGQVDDGAVVIESVVTPDMRVRKGQVLVRQTMRDNIKINSDHGTPGHMVPTTAANTRLQLLVNMGSAMFNKPDQRA